MSKKIEKLKEINMQLNNVIKILETYIFIKSDDIDNTPISTEKQISNKFKINT